jgi:hypothetical protein
MFHTEITATEAHCSAARSTLLYMLVVLLLTLSWSHSYTVLCIDSFAIGDELRVGFRKDFAS